MSTVKEVIRAALGYQISDATVDISIQERGLNPEDTRNINNNEQTKSIDLIKADLIDFLLTLPKSVKELDYQFTQQDSDALETLRRRLLAKWGIDDTPSESSFIDISNTH